MSNGKVKSNGKKTENPTEEDLDDTMEKVDPEKGAMKIHTQMTNH
jgi:hypothetical protein